MKITIDPLKPIKGLGGEQMRFPPNVSGSLLTLGTVMGDALMSPNSQTDMTKLSGREWNKRWNLATKLYEATAPMELDQHQAGLIGKRVAEVWGELVPTVVAYVYAALNPEKAGDVDFEPPPGPQPGANGVSPAPPPGNS